MSPTSYQRNKSDKKVMIEVDEDAVETLDRFIKWIYEENIRDGAWENVVSDLLLITLAVAVALNAIATFMATRRNEFTPFQKKAQLLLIWLVPFVASIGLLVFYRSMDDKTHRKSPNDTPGIGSAMGGDE